MMQQLVTSASVTLVVRRTGDLKVFVTQPDGTPVERARVSVDGPTDDPNPFRHKSIAHYTKEDGSAFFERLYPGTYNIHATKEKSGEHWTEAEGQAYVQSGQLTTTTLVIAQYITEEELWRVAEEKREELAQRLEEAAKEVLRHAGTEFEELWPPIREEIIREYESAFVRTLEEIKERYSWGVWVLYAAAAALAAALLALIDTLASKAITRLKDMIKGVEAVRVCCEVERDLLEERIQMLGEALLDEFRGIFEAIVGLPIELAWDIYAKFLQFCMSLWQESVNSWRNVLRLMCELDTIRNNLEEMSPDEYCRLISDTIVMVVIAEDLEKIRSRAKSYAQDLRNSYQEEPGRLLELAKLLLFGALWAIFIAALTALIEVLTPALQPQIWNLFQQNRGDYEAQVERESEMAVLGRTFTTIDEVREYVDREAQARRGDMDALARSFVDWALTQIPPIG